MEQTWIHQAKAGDTQAFAQLLALHQQRVYGLALRITGNPEDAADVAQEAFLKAWQGLPRFRGASSFSTWLYRLTSNAAIDLLRRESRRRDATAPVPFDGDPADLWASLPATDGDPVQSLAEKERREALLDGLAALSAEHRQVLVLRELDCLSYAEIAQLLHLEEGTVKSRIARGRLALREVLAQQGNFFAETASNLVTATGGRCRDGSV